MATSRRADTGRAYREALATIDRVAAGLPHPQLRQTLLSSPQVQWLIEADALKSLENEA